MAFKVCPMCPSQASCWYFSFPISVFYHGTAQDGHWLLFQLLLHSGTCRTLGCWSLNSFCPSHWGVCWELLKAPDLSFVLAGEIWNSVGSGSSVKHGSGSQLSHCLCHQPLMYQGRAAASCWVIGSVRGGEGGGNSWMWTWENKQKNSTSQLGGLVYSLLVLFSQLLCLP